MARAQALRERLKRIVPAFKGRVATLQKDLMTVGVSATIQGTPVDTGRLRYGWTFSSDAPSSEVPAAGAYPANAAESRALAGIQKAAPLAPLFLTNRVEYAWVLETGAYEPKNPGPSKGRGKKGSKRQKSTEGIVLVEGGFHTAAPQGMLVSGIAAIEDRVRQYGAAAGLPVSGGEL